MKFLWPKREAFIVVFLHEQQVETGKKSIGVGATMEGGFWSIFGAED
jgi:hypothetical protein